MHFRCSFGTIFARGAIQTVLAGGMLMWHGASDAATYVRLQKAPALTYTQFSGSDAKTLTGVAPTVLLHPSRFMAQNGQFCTLTTGLLDTILSNAYTDGARFQNSSWYEAATAYGYTGIAREYDILVRSARLSSTTPEEQMTVVVAAGNNFSKLDPNLTVYSPATAKNVIAVGASAIQRGPLYGGTLGGNCDTSHTIWDLADFSRQGYAGDPNRFRPDIYAPGQNVSSARSQSISSTAYS